MTNTPETSAINWLHFSDTNLWYVSCKSRTNLGPEKILLLLVPDSSAD